MGLSHSPSLVMNGLVLCLDAGNRKSYTSSRSTTTWTDLSASGNNGTIQGAYQAPYETTESLTFDGTDDYIDFGNNTTLYNAYDTSFTQEYIIKLISGASTFRTIFRVDDWSRIYTQISETQLQFGIGYSSPIDLLTYNNSFNYNQWYIISVVWSKLNTQKIYLNGTLVAERTPTVSNYTGITGTSGGANLARGHTNPYQNNINANIATFKHYNRALSAAEVSQNFNALRGRYGI